MPPSSTPDRVEERLRGRGGAAEFLRLPELLFRGLVAARGAVYDTGLSRARECGVPVLSLGNLSVGGTGKTPFSIWIARELVALGRKPGLVSRGYKSAADGQNEEARVFAAACPLVPQLQDPDRVRGARALVARGVDVIVLDDGFQHRRLARQQDWVLIDALRPWGLPRDAQGASVRALLPRGLLREPLSALARADALVITRAGDVPAEWLAELEAELAAAAPGKPLLLATHRPLRLVDAHGLPRALAELSGMQLELVSGIGNPQAFENTVRGLGAQVVRHQVFPDHHHYAPGDVRAGALPLLTTSKDAVKLAPLGLDFLVLEIELELLRGAAQARALLESLPRMHDGQG